MPTPIGGPRLSPQDAARVEDLLARMTLAEKVGQLVQTAPFTGAQIEAFVAKMHAAEAAGEPPPQEGPATRPDLEDLIRSGRVGSLLNVMDVALVNRCQRVAVEESRLGIPLLMGNDVIHGFRTIFPIPLAESCTWDPDLLERASRAAAEEASAHGIDWVFAPMVDVARDPRWGRIAESGGEDPFLGAEVARARVRGFQSDGLASGRRIAACPKHYVAYGASEAGRDYNRVDISERTLREVHLPPFRAAFEAGAPSVMSSFNEIGGVPATANPLTLRTILREEWAWAGVVLSDYDAVRELIPHGVAADLRDAARLSITAGLDMDMMSDAFAQHLAELVQSGEVPAGALDAAVRRVLSLKVGLGLFERPFVDESLAAAVDLREEHRELALAVARESMVLLKNEGGLLPLAPGARRVALVGPLADNQRDLMGTWVLQGRPEDVDSVRAGIEHYLGAGGLAFAPGCAIQGGDAGGIAEAVAAAESADVVVLVVGEGADMSGEAHSRVHLGLPGHQQALADALAATGRPLVVVLMSGRPLVIPRLAGQATALLAAWHGGTRAGRAVADLLFGAAAPSGRLTASWPRAEGQIPVYYGQKPTGRPAAGAGTQQFFEPFRSTYMDEPNAPLFPFGFGLGTTEFAFRDLAVETPSVPQGGELVVSAVVENVGGRAGVAVPQLYVRDLVCSVTRPVRELKGFRRVALAPGQAERVTFRVPADDLGCYGADMRYAVEPGEFAVWVGPDSASGLEGRFAVEP